MLKKLVVNADDYGYTPSVSKGILEAWNKKGISSTTLMVNMISEEELIWLNDSLLPYGVHLNLICGKPVSSQKPQWGLVDSSGYFHNFNVFLDKINQNMIDKNAIKEEIQCQWEKAFQSGFSPTHMDSHKHLHQHPLILRILLEFSEELQIPGLRLLPFSLKEYYRITSEYSEKDLSREITTKYKTLKGFAGQNIIRNVTIQNVEKELNLLIEENAELMVHPGYDSSELRELSTLNIQREQDLKTIISGSFKKLLSEKGIDLINYREIKGEIYG